MFFCFNFFLLFHFGAIKLIEKLYNNPILILDTINAGEDGESAKEIKMAGNLCYSVGSDHPDYVETLDNHVRCWVEFAGYVFIPKSQNVCTMHFVVCCDVRGKIPKKLANLGAPSQAINTAKLFLDNVETIQQMIKNRKENK